jgi:RNA polymerase sigma-70 factor (ECF subfamily)
MSNSYELNRWFTDEVKPHEPILRGYLRKRFPSLPDHDDVVQEAYVRVMRAADIGPLAFTKGYLFIVARNVAIDMLRRRQTNVHEPISDFTAMPILDETPGIADFLDRRQRIEVLIEAIASLPERCREVVMLRHLDGLAYKEIAERLGISPNTVKLHIIKGTRGCISYFQKHGMLDEPAPLEHHSA